MTESTQLQTTENNNAGVVKMEPPPPTTSSTSTTAAAAAAAVAAAATINSASPAPTTAMEQLLLQSQPLHQLQQQQQPQQQYALKWNDFQSSILNSFRHLRDEEDFVDVTLACDQRSFTAHKVVLSACSPYFRKLLKANPCEHPIIILRDVRSGDVENLLSFMYNGEVNVSHEYLPDFLKTAHLLQIRGLADVSGGGFPAPGFNVSSNSSSSASKSLTAALTNNSNNNNNNSTNSNNNNSNNNKLNFLTASQINNSLNTGNSLSGNLTSPFTTPAQALALAAAAAAAANSAAVPSSNLTTNNLSNSNSSSNINNNNNNCNNLSQSVGGVSGGGGSSNSNTPAIQELKASASASPANHHWDLADADNNRNSHLTPPPQKRIKSADLFRAQHGISPERLLIEREFPVAGQHPLTRERNRDRSRETSRDRERNMELRESLLGQALENSNGQQNSGNQKQHQQQHPDLASLHAQSAGEDSNSSDTEPSDRGDGQLEDSMHGSLDNQRSHSFPSAFLGLQGIPGLLPGPSGIGGNDFAADVQQKFGKYLDTTIKEEIIDEKENDGVDEEPQPLCLDDISRRSLEMRVRATDPRPCPKCGKIYRSAHTLRTHLEDKHTVCPGYRCVLCGTVAKSRNSLHSHMSRQHRGISTKDLPVLPMPSAFDPELASRLLAKAGVKISPAELRARASPTSGGGGGGGSGNGNGGGLGQAKLDLSNTTHDDMDDSDDDDPEDLTTGSGGYGMGSIGGNSNNGIGGVGNDLTRYHESLLSNFGHANTTISRIRNEAAAAAAAAALGQQKDLVGGQMPTSSASGQSLLDTYLQFITENTFGMGMSQEHAAAAALHAAKMAQLNAMGHGLDKLPPGLLPPQFDLAKLAAAGSAGNFGGIGGVVGNNNDGLTIEPIMRRDVSGNALPSENGPLVGLGHTTSSSSLAAAAAAAAASTITGAGAGASSDIRRGDSSEPMDLGLDNNASGSNNDGINSDNEENNYSEDEGVHNT